jgi:hypothetical protein
MGSVTLGHCHPNLYCSVAELREVCRREPCAAQARGEREAVSIAKDVGPNWEAVRDAAKELHLTSFSRRRTQFKMSRCPEKEICRQIAMSFEGLEHASNSQSLLLVCDDRGGMVV